MNSLVADSKAGFKVSWQVNFFEKCKNPFLLFKFAIQFSVELDLWLLVTITAHCNREWLKDLKDTSPTIEAEGQTTTSASCRRLLKSKCDSETSTTRESSADVDIKIFLFLASQGLF